MAGAQRAAHQVERVGELLLQREHPLPARPQHVQPGQRARQRHANRREGQRRGRRRPAEQSGERAGGAQREQAAHRALQSRLLQQPVDGLRQADAGDAVGDVADGVFALGGIARGVFCIGGVALGVVTLGGVSLSLLAAMGGVAISPLAFGGVAIGGAFFGESMFHGQRDASKVALVALVERMKSRGMTLLDTQFMTPHLESLGAIEIPRADYLRRLEKAVRQKVRFAEDERIIATDEHR